MQIFRAAGFAALLILSTATGLWAEDVTLTSRDGKVEVRGALIAFDGEFYRVDTKFGALTLDGTGVLCTGPGCPDLKSFVADITIAGSYTMGATLMPALVEAFAGQAEMTVRRMVQDDRHFAYLLSDRATGQPAARFRFLLSDSQAGLAGLVAGTADLAMATREIRADENEQARKAGLGDLTEAARSRIVALDAYVPIVAPGNPVQSIAPADLAQVLAGQISNWADLGGMDAPIFLHLRDSSSGLQQGLQRRLPAVEAVSGNMVIRHTTNAGLADAVARDGFALGVTNLSEPGNARPLALKGGCSFGFAATGDSLKTEDYPLTAPLFLYGPSRRLPKVARQFLAYLDTGGAQSVVRRVGFVDQVPTENAIADQGDRLANAIEQAGPETDLAELQRMVSRLRPYRRLTTTFRFEAGSSRLDAQSRANVARVAQALETGAYGQRDLLFVGFSDGAGGAAANLRIARTRATKVRDAVVKAASAADLSGFDIAIDAFGEAMPMACDDTDWGRQINRRVEVWLSHP